MRKLSFVMGLLSVVLLTGCSIYGKYGFNYNQLKGIERGMNFEEVTAILGEPVFRNFDAERDSWTFRAWGKSGWTVVKVDFKDGKVSGMKSYLEETCRSSSSSAVVSGNENQNDCKKEDSSTKVIVSPEGKHYIKTGNVVVTPEGKHIVIP